MDADEAKTVGALLRKIRLKRRLSQEVVAGLAGFTGGFLSQVERGLVPLERLSHWAASLASAACGLANTLVIGGAFTLAKTSSTTSHCHRSRRRRQAWCAPRWPGRGRCSFDGDEKAAGLARGLRAELLDLDVDAVEPMPDAMVPEGAKGLSSLAGMLAVRWGAAGLRAVLSRIQDWVSRNGRSVEVTIDGETVKVTGATSEQQEKIINGWLARHAAGP